MIFKIRLENTNDAEEFVKAASQCGGDVDLHSGVVYIDGKSLLGVMAMGIKREMNVSINNPEDSILKSAVEKFVVA
ncbi:HPr family phosphocarrier protein [Pseudobutyrivibrio xylanivorans]|uniref:HPr family phosphocarrier protein n=1 Tax=Pseudobutyrivibrio xylanivorans TaxID=185007 RepID=A0A5P6VW34_PSEXY|nr:HPr family phosphocarrier protein [Pseudobutyrivibrio xylanivorans]QFJ55871.1 HPr family phosphocarrier protein [Pseudobutyrivibrio xylanivorans]